MCGFVKSLLYSDHITFMLTKHQWIMTALTCLLHLRVSSTLEDYTFWIPTQRYSWIVFDWPSQIDFTSFIKEILKSYGYSDIYRWGGSSTTFSLIIWNPDTQDTFQLDLITKQVIIKPFSLFDFNAVFDFGYELKFLLSSFLLRPEKSLLSF